MGVINNVMKPSLVQRHTWLCLYKTLAWCIIMLWKWSMGNKKTRYQQDYSLWKEIHAKNSRLHQMESQKIEYIQNYQRKQKECVNRINTGRIPKQIWCYQSREQRLTGHPMKKWEENVRQQATWP